MRVGFTGLQYSFSKLAENPIKNFSKNVVSGTFEEVPHKAIIGHIVGGNLCFLLSKSNKISQEELVEMARWVKKQVVAMLEPPTPITPLKLFGIIFGQPIASLSFKWNLT